MKAESLNRKIKKFDNEDRLYFHRYRLSNAQYHLCTQAVSSSGLKEFFYGKNPQYCYQKYILKTIEHKTTEAMILGAAFHKLVLEPRSFKKEFAVYQGKQRRGKAFEEFEKENLGKEFLLPHHWDEIRKMRDAVARNSEAIQLLSGGVAEESVFWRDPETRVLCRARCDYKKTVKKSLILIDLKTCVSAEPEKFARDLFHMGYPLQEAMYREGFQADAFAFVAVEKITNTVQVYTLDDLFDNVGHFVFRQALEKWAECLETNVWPTYRTGVTQLNCPEYLANKVLAYD